MTMLDPRLDLFNAQKENFKKERKLCTQLPFTRLTLLTAELKVSWHYLLEISVRSSQKLENRLIRKLLNGEKKAEQKSCQVCCLLTRCTCLILNVSHF